MKPVDIKSMLDLALRARKLGKKFNPLFTGPAGVGKSEIVQQWANENKLPFVDLRIAYMESPDLIGYPLIVNENGKQKTVHVTPEFWPTEGEGLLLLEEPNRGTTSVLNTLMQLLTDRKVHKYTLPEGWIVAGCINPENEVYDVNTMDAALKNRFAIFDIDYDKNTFVKHMLETNYEKNIVDFVESGNWSFVPPEQIQESNGNKYNSPRSWSAVDAAMKAGFENQEQELELYKSILGTNTGIQFYKFQHEDAPVTADELLKHKKQGLKRLADHCSTKNYKNSYISLTVKSIIEHADFPEELFVDVALTIPADQSYALLRDYQFKKNDEKLTQKLFEKYPKLKAHIKESFK